MNNDLTSIKHEILYENYDNEMIINHGVEIAKVQLKNQCVIDDLQFQLCDKSLTIGKKHGLILGIDQIISQSDYNRILDFNRFTNDFFLGCNIRNSKYQANAFLIGIIVGIELSQFFRNKIKNHDSLNFQNNIYSFKLFIEEYGLGKSQLFDYINHIENWNTIKMPSESIIYIFELIKEDKLLRTIRYIKNVLYKNYYLESYLQINQFEEQLFLLRNCKRDKKLSSEEYLEGKDLISKYLKIWTENVSKKYSHCQLI